MANLNAYFASANDTLNRSRTREVPVAFTLACQTAKEFFTALPFWVSFSGKSPSPSKKVNIFKTYPGFHRFKTHSATSTAIRGREDEFSVFLPTHTRGQGYGCI